MASNQYVNKVVVNNETVIDLTEDTIVPAVLRKGFTAHNKSGESIVGTESFVDISDGSDAGPIIELTAKGWATQNGTPSPNSPVEIKIARGRNLLDESMVTDGHRPSSTDGQPEASASYSMTDYIEVVGGATYTIQLMRNMATTNNIGISAAYYNTSKAFVSHAVLQSGNKRIERSIVTFVVPSGASYIRIGYAAIGTNPQLELGSTATPYVPYGCVGLDVYDGSTNVSTTPIPLPSRGWVGSLPDGTADILTLNGAGKVTWECSVGGVEFDGDNNEHWTNYTADDSTHFRMATTALASTIVKPSSNSTLISLLCTQFVPLTAAQAINQGNGIGVPTSGNVTLYSDEYQTLADWVAHLASTPMTVLYPLAIPVTENMGYIDLPDISEGATISIPELDALNVKYTIDIAASILVNQMRDRFKELIAELQSDIAEIATSA